MGLSGRLKVSQHPAPACHTAGHCGTLAPTSARLAGGQGAGGNLAGVLRSSEGLKSFGWDIFLKSLGDPAPKVYLHPRF